MSIAVKCECGSKFQAKDELAGKRVKCPSCQSPLVIPSEEPAADGSSDDPFGDGLGAGDDPLGGLDDGDLGGGGLGDLGFDEGAFGGADALGGAPAADGLGGALDAGAVGTTAMGDLLGAAAPAPAYQPPTTPGTGGQPEAKPKKEGGLLANKKLLIGIGGGVGALLLLVIIGVVALIFMGGDDPPTSNSGNGQQANNNGGQGDSGNGDSEHDEHDEEHGDGGGDNGGGGGDTDGGGTPVNNADAKDMGDDLSPTELKEKLMGGWRLVEYNGNPLTSDRNAFIYFSPNLMAFTVINEPPPMIRYELNADAKPPTYRGFHSEVQEGEADSMCILRFKGDELTIKVAWSDSIDPGFPKDFSRKNGVVYKAKRITDPAQLDAMIVAWPKVPGMSSPTPDPGNIDTEDPDDMGSPNSGSPNSGSPNSGSPNSGNSSEHDEDDPTQTGSPN